MTRRNKPIRWTEDSCRGFTASPLLELGSMMGVGRSTIEAASPRWGLSVTSPDAPQISFPSELFRVENQVWGHQQLLPGLAITVNPRDHYRTDPTSRRDLSINWFWFDRQLLAEVFAESAPEALEHPDRPFRSGSIRLEPGTFARQCLLFDHILGDAPCDLLRVEEEMLSILRDIAATIAARKPAGIRDRRRSDTVRFHREVLHETQRYIEDRLGGPLRLPAIARAVGMSQGHLAEIHRRETGLAIHAYVTARRMERACQLLPDFRGRLSALAFQLGFSSGQHFSNVFRDHYGLSPTRMLELGGPRV